MSAAANRTRVWVLVLLGLAVIAAGVVFKVRIAVAGFKYLLVVAVILIVAWGLGRALSAR